MGKAIDVLRQKIAVRQPFADNENYSIGLTIKEGNDILAELEKTATNLDTQKVHDGILKQNLEAGLNQARLLIENKRLREENRWIPADEPPKEVMVSPDKADWKIYFYVLKYDAKVPEIMTAEQIWMDEGSEVEYYKPIILPEQTPKGGE